MTVCTIIPDDGKIHDPRKIGNTKKTVCGKLIDKLVRAGTGGKHYTIQQCCGECWPILKENIQKA